jgi:phage terminase Nu1 subunit (DNA packaging protein)
MTRATDATHPVDTIARVLKLTPRRVQQLSAEGVIPRAERGRYHLIPAVHGYIDYLQARRIDGGDDFATQRVRLTRARADMAEMERKQLAEELIPADDVESAWSVVVSAMRARLVAVPSKAAPTLVGKTAIEVQNSLREHINEALEELARVNIEVVAPLRASDSEATGFADDKDMPTAPDLNDL